jgi:citrate synthase
LTSILTNWINVMDWLSAPEALALLGTQPQTLYANVSRGRIKAKPDPADSRRSLYRGDDVRRLAQRGAGRRKQETIAAEAIRFGEPVLPTTISTIAEGRLLYRGQDAMRLAETRSLEDVAALLWQAPPVALPASPNSQGSSFKTALVALATRAGEDPPSFGRGAHSLRQEAASVLGTVAESLGAVGSATDPLHVRLAKSWGQPKAAEVLRRALVLLADHELNASTFAARVTVSTGASLSAAILAGMAALSGPLHGSAATAVQKLAAEVGEGGAEQAVLSRLEQGLPIPAFGHPLYPDGDVRAAALLPHLVLPRPYAELLPVAMRITGERPNIDFALAALQASLRLPPAAPLMLFALGRTVGWLAHSLEQAAEGQLIRPRANYVGLLGEATR